MGKNWAPEKNISNEGKIVLNRYTFVYSFLIGVYVTLHAWLMHVLW